MPKASVHKDDRVPLGKCDVWMPGQFGRMETVAESQGMQMAMHDQLRLRVFRPDVAHHLAALLFGNGVHQLKSNFHNQYCFSFSTGFFSRLPP